MSEMIVVVGRVRTDAQRRDGLIRVGRRVAQASRAEAGCLGYRFYEDTEDENAFVFVEEWESEAALQRHFGTPHIAELLSTIADVVVAAPDVRFHAVSGSRDLAEISRARASSSARG